jgi:UDP:flavonoid glycosyltransferase YjiC (YdhE family)
VDHRFDVITASDLRYPGGTAASIAEEVEAQAAAGYRSGLLQLDSGRLGHWRTFNARILACLQEGLAELVQPRRPVSTRLLVLRHPAVFGRPQPALEAVAAERVVMVVNQPPGDDSNDRPYYDPAAVRAVLGSAFGSRLAWAPIGPRVRRRLLAALPELGPLTEDWHNVIDPEAWAVDRSQPVGRLPVIGRHSRPDWRKWPAERRQLLAAYPADPAFRVRLLGAGRELERLVGRVPANWALLDYNAVPARRFLAGIDFFVYFTHPGWIEAFGRSILEALASGAVAVLPPVFEPLFGPAAVYCRPEQVAGRVRALHRDWPAYRRQSQAGQRAVRERFSHRRHAERVRELIGAPAGEPRRLRRPRQPDAARVLLISSNGSGIGHLTRLLAMARRAPAGLEPIFLTLSRGIDLVRRHCFLVEHLPPAPALDLAPEQWNPLIRARVSALLASYDPRLVVFDGTVPYWGLVQAMREQPQRRFVWNRRAMWRPDSKSIGLERSRYFDAVIEPGELAAAADRGPTVALRPTALQVEPMLLLEPDELLGRAAARRALGLDAAAPTFLIQLGAGNINRIQPAVDAIVERLRAAGTEVVLLRSPIARKGAGPTPGLRTVSGYPFGRYYRAFDGVFSAAGYNSFHELLAAAVPTAFVPNRQTAVDDQLARARFAAAAGLAWCIDEPTPAAVAAAVEPMLDAGQRRAISRRCSALRMGDGARQAMAALAGMIEGDRARAASAEQEAR